MLDGVSGGTLAGATKGDQCGLASRRPGPLPGQEEARLSGELRRAIGTPTRRTTTVIVADPIPAANDGRITATPLLRLQRARELSSIHNAVCRDRQAGLCCSTCGDLAERVQRLEAVSRG